MGLHIFTGTLNGDGYLELRNDLPNIFEDVALKTRANMLLLQDGASPHFNLDVRVYLTRHLIIVE